MQFCDEIVIVDTGSTDKTKEIAKQYTLNVYDFEWIDDFSAARNFAFSKCTKDWVMWLDADDCIPQKLIEDFKSLKTSLSDDYYGVFIPYRISFNTRNDCIFSYYRGRIFKRSLNLKWSGEIHESIYLDPSKALHANNCWIEHRPLISSAEKTDRNLNIMEKLLNKGDRSSRSLFYYANELTDHRQWEKAIYIYLEFLDLPSQDWEKYYALRKLSKCFKFRDNSERAIEYLLKAIAHSPERAEAFTELGLIYYVQNQFNKALPFFAAASSLPKPDNLGFLEEQYYTYLSKDYLAICLSRIGQIQKAKDLTEEILDINPDKERLLANLKYYNSKL